MIKPGYLKKTAEDALHISIKEASHHKYIPEEFSILTITDLKRIIHYANDNSCKIPKYSAPELIGQDTHVVNQNYKILNEN